MGTSFDISSKQGFNDIQISHNAFFLILEQLNRDPLVIRGTAASQYNNVQIA